MLEKRCSSVSFALECALLFLAIFVFSWGLQAKLVLYHSNPGTSSTTNSMAKLSTETRSAQTVDSVKEQLPARLAFESLHWAAFAPSRPGHTTPPLAQSEHGPNIPGQYYLHGPDPKRRPPPALS